MVIQRDQTTRIDTDFVQHRDRNDDHTTFDVSMFHGYLSWELGDSFYENQLGSVACAYPPYEYPNNELPISNKNCCNPVRTLSTGSNDALLSRELVNMSDQWPWDPAEISHRAEGKPKPKPNNRQSEDDEPVSYQSSGAITGHSGTIDLRNVRKLEELFDNRFRAILVNPCRPIAAKLIDTLCPDKKTKNPYQHKNSRKQTEPNWWPNEVPFSSPHHMKRKDLLVLLCHILTLPLKDLPKVNTILQDLRLRSWSQLLEAAQQQLNLRDVRGGKIYPGEEGFDAVRHRARLRVLENMYKVSGESAACAARNGQNYLADYEAVPKELFRVTKRRNTTSTSEQSQSLSPASCITPQEPMAEEQGYNAILDTFLLDSDPAISSNEVVNQDFEPPSITDDDMIHCHQYGETGHLDIVEPAVTTSYQEFSDSLCYSEESSMIPTSMGEGFVDQPAQVEGGLDQSQLANPWIEEEQPTDHEYLVREKAEFEVHPSQDLPHETPKPAVAVRPDAAGQTAETQGPYLEAQPENVLYAYMADGSDRCQADFQPLVPYPEPSVSNLELHQHGARRSLSRLSSPDEIYSRKQRKM